MAIFLNQASRVIVQGMTGSEGRKHTERMLVAGTTIVGGVTPGKGGEKVEFDGASVPVFGSVQDAIDEAGADASVVFVPPKFAKAAVIEAIDAGLPLAIVITEGIPVHDTVAFWAYNLRNGGRTRIVGPNCPGVISPGQSNAGIIPADITSSGRIGLVSKSGTLTYQMMYELRDYRFLHLCRHRRGPGHRHHAHRLPPGLPGRPDTDAIVMIGEIGGDAEERAADYIRPTSPNPWSRTWPGSPHRRARPWDTPGLSSPDLPALPAPRRQPSKPSASKSVRPRPRPRPCSASASAPRNATTPVAGMSRGSGKPRSASCRFSKVAFLTFRTEPGLAQARARTPFRPTMAAWIYGGVSWKVRSSSCSSR